jgi:hypothetical protein
MGPGIISAFTRVFDALWAGTTKILGQPAALMTAGIFRMGSVAMTVVVMAPVVPIVVVVVMMPMVMMVTPVVPMMAVVSVMMVMTMMAPHMGPVSRHGGGRQSGILRHGRYVGGRLGGRGRRSHTCRDGDEHQQPLEHETSSRIFCGTHRKAKERAMNPN